MEQAQVQVGRKQGMPKGWLTAHHRVLIGAKAIKASRDEMLQHRQGLLAVYGPSERLENSWQGAQPHLFALPIKLLHLGNHGAGDRIGLKPERLGPLQTLRRRFAVVCIEIPLATDRLCLLALSLHQYAKAATPLPVKQLQAQLFVPLRPGAEFLAAPEKGVALDPTQRHRQLERFDRAAKASISRLHHPQFMDASLLNPGEQCR